jgi:hypothetical protein
MKTTIDIPDSLFSEAKKLAAQEQTTLKALIEQGLRHMMTQYKADRKFVLRKASFKGQGLQSEFIGEGWEKIRSAAYEGHGG